MKVGGRIITADNPIVEGVTVKSGEVSGRVINTGSAGAPSTMGSKEKARIQYLQAENNEMTRLLSVYENKYGTRLKYSAFVTEVTIKIDANKKSIQQLQSGNKIIIRDNSAPPQATAKMNIERAESKTNLTTPWERMDNAIQSSM